MLEVLPFIVCVVLRYHYHDAIPGWVWIAVVLCMFSSPVLKLKRE